MGRSGKYSSAQKSDAIKLRWRDGGPPSGRVGKRIGETEHLVLGLHNVVAHRQASTLVVPVPDRAQNLVMLTPGDFSKVIDIDGRKHYALHLAARLTHGLQKHLVAGETGDADMKGGVRFNEIHAALAVLGSAGYLGPFGEFLEAFGGSALD